MKGGGLCPDLSFDYQGAKFTPYTWGSDGGVASMFGDSRCGFFIEVGEPAQGDTPRNDYFINIKNDSKLGGVPQIEQITEQTTKLEGTKKIELSQLQLDMEKNPIENLDKYFEEVEKKPYSVIQFNGTKMTRFKPPKAPAQAAAIVPTTDVEGDRFTIKQDIEKVTHNGVDVLKTVGPVKLFDKNDKEVDKMEGEEEKTEKVMEIVNKGNVAKVLCLPISLKLGSAEDTKVLFNLSDNSRRLAEITKEDEGLKATRGTDHLKNKMYELHRSLDVLFMQIDGKTSEINETRTKDKVIGNTGGKKGLNLVLDKDTSLSDSIKNYREIFKNLNPATTPESTLDDFKNKLLDIDILKGIVEDLKSNIFLNLNDPKKPLPNLEKELNNPLKGEKLYKFCSAIQIKVVALTTLLGKVTSLKKDDEGQLIVVEKNGEKELSDSVLNERERTKHYFIASKLNFSGSMKDLSVKEHASDLARNTSILRRNIRQGVENTSIQGIGKGIGKGISKGVGNAGKGLMSFFTKKNQTEDGTEVPANTTGGGKRKTRKKKARKTRRKVQRKRRQSKKH
jgi:hypothetical protein